MSPWTCRQQDAANEELRAGEGTPMAIEIPELYLLRHQPPEVASRGGVAIGLSDCEWIQRGAAGADSGAVTCTRRLHDHVPLSGVTWTAALSTQCRSCQEGRWASLRADLSGRAD